MTHLLNNIVANFDWASVAYFVATFVEGYLFITLLLVIFDIKASNKQKILHLLIIIPVSQLTLSFIPSPFNVIINYTCTILSITLIFKQNLLISFTAFALTSFVFGVLNTLLQNPYLALLKISTDEFINIPKYQICYLM